MVRRDRALTPAAPVKGAAKPTCLGQAATCRAPQDVTFVSGRSEQRAVMKDGRTRTGSCRRRRRRVVTVIITAVITVPRPKPTGKPIESSEIENVCNLEGAAVVQRPRARLVRRGSRVGGPIDHAAALSVDRHGCVGQVAARIGEVAFCAPRRARSERFWIARSDHLHYSQRVTRPRGTAPRGVCRGRSRPRLPLPGRGTTDRSAVARRCLPSRPMARSRSFVASSVRESRGSAESRAARCPGSHWPP